MADITDEQIAAAVRPLYADDTAASMGLTDDIRTVRTVLALQPSASAEPVQAVVWALKFPGDGGRLCLSTIFDTEDEAKDYASRRESVEVVPLAHLPVTAAREQEASATGAVAWLAENQDGSFDAYKDVHSLIDDCRQGFPVYATPTTSTTGKVDVSRVRDEALEEAVGLYESEDVLAPVGNSACGEAYQEGWIAGAQAYREAIRSLIGTPKSAEGEGA